ncbi:hypothetical protein DBR39_09730 [Chryseobacterium sp. KBW03]|jgi:hypothetical protein|uniref:hypothetical protein n=1 Tax=Chryseobacterium sp. KBW03 TaxID=2153362 RepID=UPI000F5A1F59|nr:hypothetical protein [Chryseobacterium sp. KBW03]RQO39256.1 hypothetical protein DBR39_09730 [Chryseobacterium sp. KBW03]
MKPTKEQIIEIGLKIVSDIFNEAYNIKSASATQGKVKLYSLGNDGYYEHDGWHFNVDSEKKYVDEHKSFFIYFLDNGIPLHMTSFLGDDKPKFVYAIKKDNKYIAVNEIEYFKYQNFDLKKFIKKDF